MKKSNKIVLLDIDDTIFNTARFRKNLNRDLYKMFKIKESDSLIETIYEKIKKKNGYFLPKLFLEELSKKINGKHNKNLINKIIWNKNNFKANLYREVRGVVKRISHEAIVGIFSKGDKRFQQNKLLKIKYLFEDEHIHVVPDKSTELPKLIKKYRSMKVFLFDDFLNNLIEAKKLDKNIFTIWVRRGRFRKIQETSSEFAPDKIIRNLKNADSIIKKY